MWRAPVPDGCAAAKVSHDERLRPLLSVLLVACQVLRLDMETTFAAACLLHRFYLLQRHSPSFHGDGADNVEHKWQVVCIIFIACKTQEDHRRLRDFINLAHMISWRKTAITWDNVPPPLDDDYWKDKQHIVRAEQTVLRLLAFDVHVSHPHRMVVLLTKDCLAEIDQVKTNTLVEETWTLLNACIFSVAALRLPVLVLAVAALDTTIHRQQQQRSNEIAEETTHNKIPTGWWENIGVSVQAKQEATQLLQAVVDM